LFIVYNAGEIKNAEKKKKAELRNYTVRGKKGKIYSRRKSQARSFHEILSF